MIVYFERNSYVKVEDIISYKTTKLLFIQTNIIISK